MRQPAELPSGLPVPAFSVSDAAGLGISPGRLRRSDLEAPFHGIRSTAQPLTVIDRCLAYSPRLRDGQFFSHVTAAGVLGLPLPRSLEARMELDVSGISSRPRTRGVIGHRCVEPSVVSVRGLQITHPSLLLIELATVLGLDDLIVAGVALVRRKRPATTLADIHAALSTAHGQGVRLARHASALVREGADSPMETRLRLLIVRAGLPEPVIGHLIRDARGDYIGRPDLAYLPEKIAIEYEGDQHRTDPRVFADDIERREQMQEAGWYVIRVIKDHVYKWPFWLADRIARALVERAAE